MHFDNSTWRPLCVLLYCRDLPRNVLRFLESCLVGFANRDRVKVRHQVIGKFDKCLAFFGGQFFRHVASCRLKVGDATLADLVASFETRDEAGQGLELEKQIQSVGKLTRMAQCQRSTSRITPRLWT